MIHVRFRVRCSDFRPVVWPIKYPYWCSGFNDKTSTLLAYVENQDELLRLWPDAEDIEVLDENATIKFSERFAQPKWFKKDGSHYKEPTCPSST